MLLENHRLDNNCVNDLVELSKVEGFPLELKYETAIAYCSGNRPYSPKVQTYGVYNSENKLVSVMTATFCQFFPHEDGPSGKVVQVSGAFTMVEYRKKGYASELIRAIEQDAKTIFNADYMCCDSTFNKLYEDAGFVPAPSDESRMWKALNS